eukprot:5647083-Heterocapsa_arctica.AAC.1
MGPTTEGSWGLFGSAPLACGSADRSERTPGAPAAHVPAVPRARLAVGPLAGADEHITWIASLPHPAATERSTIEP